MAEQGCVSLIAITDGESTPLIAQHQDEAVIEPKVYGKRWLILGLFWSLFVLRMNLTLTYASLVGPAEIAFGWAQSDLALLTAWNSAVALLAMPLWAWFINAKGLRISHCLAATFLAAAAILKCLTSTPPYVTWFTNLACILAAFAHTYMMAAIPRISSTWFPVKERILATSVGMSGGPLGGVVSYILGPSIVRVGKSDVTNITDEGSDIITVRAQIMTVNYIQCALCTVLFIVTMLFFQARPPKPPSVSSKTKRYSFKAGLKIIATERKFWLMGCLLALHWGTSLFILGIMGLITHFREMDEYWTSVMGSGYNVLSLVASIVTARIADFYIRRIKLLIIGLLAGYLAFIGPFIVYLLTGNDVGSLTFALCFIFSAAPRAAAVPIIVEYLCEVTYPVDESTANGVGVWMVTLVEFCWYAALILSGEGMRWVAVTICVLIIIEIGLISSVKEEYGRHNIDVAH